MPVRVPQPVRENVTITTARVVNVVKVRDKGMKNSNQQTRVGEVIKTTNRYVTICTLLSPEYQLIMAAPPPSDFE